MIHELTNNHLFCLNIVMISAVYIVHVSFIYIILLIYFWSFHWILLLKTCLTIAIFSKFSGGLRPPSPPPGAPPLDPAGGCAPRPCGRSVALRATTLHPPKNFTLDPCLCTIWGIVSQSKEQTRYRLWKATTPSKTSVSLVNMLIEAVVLKLS